MKLRFTTLALFLFVAAATAETPPAIGVSAPLSGSNALLGAQVASGAREAAAKAGIRLVEADDGCTAEGGRAAAERFVAEKVQAVVGYLCGESLEAALPVLRAAGIPALDVGVRADRFTAQRRKTGNLVWRIAPRADAEAQALAALVVSNWRAVPFGILDDGSIGGRGLADAVRAAVEAAGLRPAAIDSYRPAEEKQFGVVRRLARTGITHFAIAGDRGDAATIARDAAANGLGIEIAGGEALLDEPPDAAELPAGTLAVAPVDRFPKLNPPGEADAGERRGYYGPAAVAVEIAAAAAASGKPIAAALNETEFATSLGAVRFDANGDSDLALFRVFRFDGRDFVPATGG